ncbi:MAG: LacI family DNA-binding transcriptional regulator [Trueperaceae bacterium]|nr:LacI family DNA-binding transcriptional regulator [Trueperaceae bacterium]
MEDGRKATLKDVAQLAGVSTVTVSNVLNHRQNVSLRTRQRVMKAVEETGYRVNLIARGLAGGRTNTLGVVVPDLGTQYVGEIVRGLGDEIRHAGLEMLISTASDDIKERSQMDLLQEISDGLVLVLAHNNDYDVSVFSRDGLPVVMIDHRGSTIPLPAVDVDNYYGGRQATEYLIALGHQRIGFVKGRYEASSLRFKGYKEALECAKLPFEESLVAEGEFTQPGGFAAANELLNLKDLPSAIFAANDLSAFGVMEAIKEKGLRIPDDISVLGFDDIPMANQVFPALSTIRQPLFEMGQAAARMMLAKLRGVEPPSNRITLATELVERASTRAWRNRSDSKEGGDYKQDWS